ncbi:MAG: hypothetical protein O6700_00700, partial [Gammaproteobacteria bacterium]|nr:hypothetical protein [Gammaproteobacteria bacterium]
NFDVENKTLLIRKPIEDNALEKGRDLQWVVTTIGESELDTYCDSPVNESGFVHCVGSSVFRFNTNTLRYLHAVTFGYYSATPGEGDGGDTPYMEIGRCSPI